jgi:hypothetical protein
MLTRKQFNRRLLKLASILDVVPRHKFDMRVMDDIESEDCGTSVCAAGWARSDKTLRKAIDNAEDGPIKSPTHYRLMAAFGLTGEQCNTLFQFRTLGPQSTPKQKAKQIRQMVATELQ